MTIPTVHPADAVVKRVIADLGKQSQEQQVEQQEHVKVGERLTDVFAGKPVSPPEQEEVNILERPASRLEKLSSILAAALDGENKPL